MSGGSLDYVYRKVADAAQTILSRPRNPLHLAFARHLIKVSKALHDLEWVYSGDYSEPDEEEAIRAVCMNSVPECPDDCIYRVGRSCVAGSPCIRQADDLYIKIGRGDNQQEKFVSWNP